MERKEDVHTRENIDRGAENEQASSATSKRNNNYNGHAGASESETIKNANAAGLGAIGRNDQKQEYASTGSGDGGY